MKIAPVFLVLILIFVKKSTSQGVCVTVEANKEETYKETYEKCDCDASNIDVNVKTFDPKDKPEQCGKGKPKSCEDVKMSDAKIKTKTGGVFDIYDESTGKYVEVYCDLNTDGGKWTVFQTRMDGSEDFYRGWDDYVNGFGRKDKEFWLGLENLHQMTKNGSYELRVDLGAFDGSTAYATYKSFSIGSSAGNYRLNVDSYSGTAGDSLAYHNGMPFTTKDQDNDELDENCAVDFHGGWWYKRCANVNLNGQYRDTVGSGHDGVDWWEWKRDEYLKSTEMKFRRAE